MTDWARKEPFDFRIEDLKQTDWDVRGVQGYMHVDGIPGPCIVAGEEGGMFVLSWTHSFWTTSKLERDSNGGLAESLANHGDIEVVKAIDSTTPSLLKNTWKGLSIPNIEIRLHRAESQPPYFFIKYTEVLIVAHTFFDVPGNKDSLERLKFNYNTVSYSNVPFDQQAAPAGNDVILYNRSTKTVS